MYEIAVNGEVVETPIDGATTLADFLRFEVDLSDVRIGCSVGECGACTVLVDGEAATSCQVDVASVHGRTVATLSGSDPDLERVTRAFVEASASQCGYCIPGIIAKVASLADDSTDSDLLNALDAHVCRCGSHSRILRAARTALGLDEYRQAGEIVATSADDIADEPTDSGATDDASGVPVELRHRPDVGSWLTIAAAGTIEVNTGKVELGQGIHAAFRRMVASQLEVPLTSVSVLPVSTSTSPDEGVTSGSHSIDHSGVGLAWAARALRRAVIAFVADELGCAVDDVVITGGHVGRDEGTMRRVESVLASIDVADTAIGKQDRPDWARLASCDAISSDELRDKLEGRAPFLHDLSFDRMLYARAVMPPSQDAVLSDIDTSSAAHLSGVVDVVRTGAAIVVIAERDADARAAVERLAGLASWDVPNPRDELITDRNVGDVLPRLAARELVHPSGDGRAASGEQLSRTYSVPYQAHASIAPSAAIASYSTSERRWDVWTHSQGIHQLRRELSCFEGLQDDEVNIHHVAGPGCYGQNLADDAAGFAVFAAQRVPDRPIRFQFTSAQEFAWEPLGSAMLIELDASTAAGELATWHHTATTDIHSRRPRGDGDALLVRQFADGLASPWHGPHEAGIRNAIPPYDIPSAVATGRFVEGPLRTGSLRSLGAFANVFASESFVDELCEHLSIDPLAFRRRLAADARLAAVIDELADRIDWRERTAPSGRGIGVAACRYKDEKAYVAQAVEVRVDPTNAAIDVLHIVTVCDAGAVVDRDGLVNQLDGGTLQALSRTLHERISFRGPSVADKDFGSYGVLPLRATPTLTTHVLHRPGHDPLGAGEVTVPTVPAAVANAIDDAVGIRMRHLPITPSALEKELLRMSDAELARVRLASS